MFWKRKKCATCKSVLKEKKGIHELRVNTADGLTELEVCGKCADFWDKTAEVLNDNREKKPSHTGSDEEVDGGDDS